MKSLEKGQPLLQSATRLMMVTRARFWETRLHQLLALPVSLRCRWSAAFISATVAVHVFIFVGILNLYFSTPIVDNIPTAHQARVHPPSRRVFLIVVDGLGAKVLFNSQLQGTPNFRNVALKRGVVGVSYVRTPTLSRPGHLSLVSGVYEYMHGITRGREYNPFDTIVNRSAESWLFGEGEIVSMFVRAPSKTPVHTFSYPDHLNDFSMADPALLDHWVFKRLHQQIANFSKERIPKEGVFFMLHLLGVDTFSHSHTAHGDGLAKVIAAVDKGIEEIEAQVEKTFKHDGKTTYIVTADHGMSPWSAHGAGDTREEVTTPYIAWGAGIRSGVRGKDIAQVDVCPLVASLLGLQFPTHSVGKVPTHLLDLPLKDQIEILRANTKQVVEQFLAMRRQVKASCISPLFTEYHQLNPHTVSKRFKEISHFGNSTKAMALLEKLHKDAVDGLYYFHHYHAFLEKATITCLFLLIILLLAVSLVEDPSLPTDHPPRMDKKEFVLFLLIYLSQFAMTIVERRSIMHLIIWTFLVWFSWSIFQYRRRVLILVSLLGRYSDVALSFVFLELVVFGFIDRRIISVMIIFHCAWQLRQTAEDDSKQTMRRCFLAGSVLIAIFPFLPTIGMFRSTTLVCTGSALTAVCSLVFIFRTARSGQEKRSALFLLLLQVIFLACSAVILLRAHASIKALSGLAPGTILFTRGLLLLSLAAVGLVSYVATPLALLVSVWLGIALTFTLVSLAFETVFVFSFGVTLLTWLKTNEGHTDEWWRPTLSYIVLTFSSLFGIGNFPTISSYDPQMVLCFQSVFDLAVMGIVMFLRNMLPVQMTTSPFLVLLSNVEHLQIYRLSILFVDLIAVQFFLRLHQTDDFLYLARMVNNLSISMAFIVMVSLCFIVHRLVFSHRL